MTQFSWPPNKLNNFSGFSYFGQICHIMPRAIWENIKDSILFNVTFLVFSPVRHDRKWVPLGDTIILLVVTTEYSYTFPCSYRPCGQMNRQTESDAYEPIVQYAQVGSKRLWQYLHISSMQPLWPELGSDHVPRELLRLTRSAEFSCSGRIYSARSR